MTTIVTTELAEKPPVWTFKSSAVAYTGGGDYSAAHGLGAVPEDFAVFGNVLTAVDGWEVGDLVKLGSHFDNGVAGYTIYAEATHIHLTVNGSIRHVAPGADGAFGTSGDLELIFTAN